MQIFTRKEAADDAKKAAMHGLTPSDCRFFLQWADIPQLNVIRHPPPSRALGLSDRYKQTHHE